MRFNLGLEYSHTGWLSKTVNAWEKAWASLKTVTDPTLKPLADRAAGELASMYVRLGRKDDLSALLDSIQGRPIFGSAAQNITAGRQGLWFMQNEWGHAYRCGSLALDAVRGYKNRALLGDRLIRKTMAGTNGMSLSQVFQLSEELRMNMQMAYRSNSAAIVLPAVVHWKMGHFAALLREENGLYLLAEPAIAKETWISRRALEAEASGYCLLAAASLPAGWREVNATEGNLVLGKGATSGPDKDATTPKDKPCYKCMLGALGGGAPAAMSALSAASGGMATHNVLLMSVSLRITDSPVGYSPPIGPPMRFVATYNQREAGQPAIFSYSNLGPLWTFNWLAYITDNPSAPSADVSYYTDGGGTLPFTGFNSQSQTFATQMKNQALLTRTSTNSYEMLLPDGSKCLFAQPDSVGGTSRQVFMTQLIDARGNAVQISYDSSFRVVALTDAIGQVTVFAYQNTNDNLKITQVTDPFGRFAAFNYDPSGRLTNITDSIGLNSQFKYDSGTFIQALITPYGTTSFTNGQSGRTIWLETTHPTGEKERVEFNETYGVGAPASELPASVPQGMWTCNAWLWYRSTYYWDRNAYSAYAISHDYTKARIYHWLHMPGLSLVSGIEESEKMPLENRVWYDYDGQYPAEQTVNVMGTSGQPSAIGRVLDDGTTQLRRFKYNALGHVTNSVNPIGRSMTYIYSTNLVDLLEVHQTTGTNNDLIAKYLYNSQHLPVATWDAAGQMTTNIYNPRGQLLTTTNPRGETRKYNYDTNGYLLSIDGPLPGTNDVTSFTYDVVGRVRTTTGPDGYTLTYGYDNLARLTNITYPDATFEAFAYKYLDRVQSQDRLGRITYYAYDLLRQLTSVQDPLGRTTRYEYCGCGSMSALIDPMGRKTTWDHDVQGRVTGKQYADGSRVAYTYENTTSSLKLVTDEKGQLKVYSYFPDDNRSSISYPNAQIATPTVTFTFDPNYNRMTSMQDGIGTTMWSYYPAGGFGALQVASANGPWNIETVIYQYDELGRVTNRAINGVFQTYAFDPLGRTTNVVNALGSFAYDYDSATARLLDALYPNGQTSHYDYFDNLGDHRLQRITHSKPDASLISRFTYAHNPVGNITNWLQEMGPLTETWSIGYDPADQLLSVADNQGGTNTINYAYAYDPAGNRLSETTNGVSRSFTYNALNELISSSDTNPTNITYQWDAEQRLVGIIQGTNQSLFAYDGLGKRCRIVETAGGATNADRRFVWCDMKICEERNGNNALVNWYFAQGEQQQGTNLYYTRDHLRSVRGLSDQAVNQRGVFAYNPFGNMTELQGDHSANFGFTGHFLHSASDLVLAPYRAYSPSSARWMSRDPAQEKFGVNLYAYVGNNPLTRRDSLGLEDSGFGFDMGGGYNIYDNKIRPDAPLQSDPLMSAVEQIMFGSGVAVVGVAACAAAAPYAITASEALLAYALAHPDEAEFIQELLQEIMGPAGNPPPSSAAGLTGSLLGKAITEGAGEGEGSGEESSGGGGPVLPQSQSPPANAPDAGTDLVPTANPMP